MMRPLCLFIFLCAGCAAASPPAVVQNASFSVNTSGGALIVSRPNGTKILETLGPLAEVNGKDLDLARAKGEITVLPRDRNSFEVEYVVPGASKIIERFRETDEHYYGAWGYPFSAN